MSEQFGRLLHIAFRSVVATVCCILLGLVFYQQQVWNIYYPHFRFVTYGVVGSLFFCSLRSFGFRTAIAVLVVLFFLEAQFVLDSFHDGRFLNDLIYFTIAPVAVLLFYRFFHSKVEATTLFDPIILGALFAGTGALARILFDIHRDIQLQYWTIFHPWQLAPDLGMNFLIGFALAAGLFISERHKSETSTGRVA